MARTKLTKYVENSLQMGAGELFARFNNEFSYEEKVSLAEAVRLRDERVQGILGEFDWLYDVIPDLRQYHE